MPPAGSSAPYSFSLGRTTVLTGWRPAVLWRRDRMVAFATGLDARGPPSAVVRLLALDAPPPVAHREAGNLVRLAPAVGRGAVTPRPSALSPWA